VTLPGSRGHLAVPLFEREPEPPASSIFGKCPLRFHPRLRRRREECGFGLLAPDFLLFSRGLAGSRTPMIGVQLGGSLAGKLSLELASTSSEIPSSPFSDGFNELNLRTNLIPKNPARDLQVVTLLQD